MFKTKIMYIILFIISIVFFILYNRPLSLYLMIFIAVLPLFLGISALLAKKSIRASIETGSDTAIKNEKINLSVNLRNRTPFPFPNSVVTVEYFNSLLGVRGSMIITVPIHDMCSEKICFSLISDHCGILDVKIKSVRVFDFIKLFSCKIKPGNSYKITVLPEIYPLSSSGSLSLINAEESDIFSKYKSGDDPSEIFALKNYVPGDKPNRIHWNLSLKQDELIVRHYSQPVNSSILLILDFCGTSGKDAQTLDAAAETAFSISFFLSENDIPFKFAYYNHLTEKDIIVSVSDEKDIAPVLKGVFTIGPAEKTDFAVSIKDMLCSCSCIFYVTTSAENLSKILRENDCENLRPIFIDSGSKDNFIRPEFANEITVIPAAKAQRFISDILI